MDKKKKATSSSVKTAKKVESKGKSENKGKKSEKKVNPVAAFLWKDKRRRAKNFYGLLVAVLILLTAAMGFVSEKFDLMDTGDDTEQSADGQDITSQVIFDEEDIEMMEAISSAGSLNDFLYQWANNGGELYSSKNVINVLLSGLDSKDALENGGRSDTNIIISINKKTEKINMISLFRDSWCYMNLSGKDSYGKLNSSYYYGGATALIDTIEKNFKIDIDYYVAVDFSSFVDIINALGGIDVEVQEYEANYMNRTNPEFNIVAGSSVHLTGKEALVFARIRKSDSDSDVSRTRRQRQVIASFIESAKGASISQLNDVLNTLFKYVKTDLTQSQILSYATQALAKGWLNYEIVSFSLSDPEIFRTGYVGSAAVVFMDFPLAAQMVQQAIYDDTNIVLDEGRQTVFQFATRFD